MEAAMPFLRTLPAIDSENIRRRVSDIDMRKCQIPNSVHRGQVARWSLRA